MKDIKLSEHFRLSEFVSSPTARRLRIDNTPDSAALHNLQLLCTYLLEPIRKAFRQPIIINSGYRCRQLNRAVGGAQRSLHLSGRAADIVAGITPDQMTNDKLRMTNQMEANRRLKAVIDDLGLPCSELIYEKPTRDGTPRWIHIAI